MNIWKISYIEHIPITGKPAKCSSKYAVSFRQKDLIFCTD